jgi:hypothetical protein
MGTQLHERFEQRLILRHHHATVSIATEILRGKEAVGANRGSFAGHHRGAVDQPTGADRLGRIFDDRPTLCRVVDVLDGRHLTEQVDSDHRLRLPAHGRTDRVR